MDELRIWNTARTIQEIRANMHNELSGNESDLKAYWNFNALTGQTVNDISSNNQNGQLGYNATIETNEPFRKMEFIVNDDIQRELGSANYELSNHLGNVLSVVSDRKIKTINNVQVGGFSYIADVISTSDYYPFGSVQPGRSYTSDAYRYGFNGQEKDDEVAGAGNSMTAMFWQYDTRLGRRWNLDPKPNPSISQYATFANNPIWFSDPNGDTLDIIGDDSEKDINNLVNEGNNQFITYTQNEDGTKRVGFDFGDRTEEEVQDLLKNDQGLKLIYDLVNGEIKENGTVRGAKFLYSTNATYQYVDRNTGDTKTKVLIGDDPVNAISNISITPRLPKYPSYAPPKGYDGTVNIVSGQFIDKATLVNVRENFVMHELYESYFRTIMKLPYTDGSWDSGAHGEAKIATGKKYPSNPGEADGIEFIAQ